MLKFDLPGLNFGEVEDVVDDGEHRAACGADRIDEAALLVCQACAEQQLVTPTTAALACESRG